LSFNILNINPKLNKTIFLFPHTYKQTIREIEKWYIISHHYQSAQDSTTHAF